MAINIIVPSLGESVTEARSEELLAVLGFGAVSSRAENNI